MPKVSLNENDNIFTFEAEEDEIIYHALERQGKKLPPWVFGKVLWFMRRIMV